MKKTAQLSAEGLFLGTELLDTMADGLAEMKAAHDDTPPKNRAKKLKEITENWVKENEESWAGEQVVIWRPAGVEDFKGRGFAHYRYDYPYGEGQSTLMFETVFNGCLGSVGIQNDGEIRLDGAARRIYDLQPLYAQIEGGGELPELQPQFEDEGWVVNIDGVFNPPVTGQEKGIWLPRLAIAVVMEGEQPDSLYPKYEVKK